MTIAKAVRYVIKLVDRKTKAKEEESQAQEEPAVDESNAAKYAESTNAYLSAALGIVESAGKAIHSYIMRPFYVVFCILLIVASLPVGVLRYFATGEVVE